MNSTPTSQELTLDEIVSAYRDNRHLIEKFKNGVIDSFRLDPTLNAVHKPIIHSLKARLKDETHLKEKILRKIKSGKPEITKDNLFSRVTDLAGVRVLHLYQDQFPDIHQFIDAQILNGEWVYVEQPIAYSWDPEASEFFQKFGLRTEIKESFYTSIHYTVRPNNTSSIACCEIQVRTLFEEIWGEIDHAINYPDPTTSKSCKEQIKVLSKLVSTGTRLADSIFRCHHDTK